MIGQEAPPASVTLIEACREMDAIDLLSTLEEIPTVEEMRADFADRDPQNVLFALHGDEMIASIRLSWWTEADGTWLYLNLGQVVPQWRGRGLGTAMLHWAEERIRALANEHPTNGKGVFGANASSTEKTATELLLNEGYRCLHINALIDFTYFGKFTQPRLPAKIELPSFTPDHLPFFWEPRPLFLAAHFS